MESIGTSLTSSLCIVKRLSGLQARKLELYIIVMDKSLLQDIMIDETDIDMTVFRDSCLKESEDVDDPKLKHRLEKFVDGLKNDGKAFGYVDKCHWYIRIS